MFAKYALGASALICLQLLSSALPRPREVSALARKTSCEVLYGGTATCYAPGHIRQAERLMPAAVVNPVVAVAHTSHLPLTGVAVIAVGPKMGSRPPVTAIDYAFGRSHVRADCTNPSRTSWLDVGESVGDRGLGNGLRSICRNIWLFSTYSRKRHLTIVVESNLPTAETVRVGHLLQAAS